MLTYKLFDNEKFKKAYIKVNYLHNPTIWAPAYYGSLLTTEQLVKLMTIEHAREVRRIERLTKELALVQKAFEKYKKNAERLLQNG